MSLDLSYSVVVHHKYEEEVQPLLDYKLSSIYGVHSSTIIPPSTEYST